MLCFIAATVISLAQTPSAIQAQPSAGRKVALLPWTLAGGTDTANTRAREVTRKLFEGVNYEVLPEVRAKGVWEDDMGSPKINLVINERDAYPDLPTASQLLALGKLMGADIVCAGRAKWHTKSIWVGLGPKTKADCTVDVMIIDVAKEEVVLDARNVKSDSTKKEHALESFGALFIAGGITMLSGGPKTPHQVRAAENAIALSLAPWLQTTAQASRKIVSTSGSAPAPQPVPVAAPAPAPAPSPTPAPAPAPAPAPLEGLLDGLIPDKSAMDARIKEVTITTPTKLRAWDTIVGLKLSAKDKFEEVATWSALQAWLLQKQARGEVLLKIRRDDAFIESKAIAK